MKMTSFAKPIVLALIASATFVGCKSPVGLTAIPGQTPPGSPTDPSALGALAGNASQFPLSDSLLGIPQTDQDRYKDYIDNPSALQLYTVHFDFDSSAIKSSEESNVSSVAAALKSQATAALRVEGHCDERGTEEYNRSLGERRAVALREKLAGLGIDPQRILTRSYGEDKAVDHGHNEAAYSKNRRGEFILLTPPRVAASVPAGAEASPTELSLLDVSAKQNKDDSRFSGSTPQSQSGGAK